MTEPTKPKRPSENLTDSTMMPPPKRRSQCLPPEAFGKTTATRGRRLITSQNAGSDFGSMTTRSRSYNSLSQELTASSNMAAFDGWQLAHQGDCFREIQFDDRYHAEAIPAGGGYLPPQLTHQQEFTNYQYHPYTGHLLPTMIASSRLNAAIYSDVPTLAGPNGRSQATSGIPRHEQVRLNRSNGMQQARSTRNRTDEARRSLQFQLNNLAAPLSFSSVYGSPLFWPPHPPQDFDTSETTLLPSTTELTINSNRIIFQKQAWDLMLWGVQPVYAFGGVNWGM